MVLSEVLRLYPPSYGIVREAVDTFKVGEYTIPAGTLVILSPYVTQRDSRFFPDALRFGPQRWHPKTGSKQPRFAFFPFSGGRCDCIGRPYALQEAMLVIATLAQDWRMRLAPHHPVEFLQLMNLRSKYGMRMVLERRR
jgi:cytochrome P450